MTDIKELKLIPPTDARVNNAIAPFMDDMLKDEGFKDRKELSEAMFFLHGEIWWHRSFS